MSNSSPSIPDELLHIHSTLRRLNCIQTVGADQPSVGVVDAAIFPSRFLLKILDERLEDLSEFAREICDDLFKQIGGKPQRIDQKQLDRLDQGGGGSGGTVGMEHEFIRYPEFDEYFHCCIHYLYDFLIDLRWHKTDIDTLTPADSDYVSKTLNRISQFFKFKESLNNQVKNGAPIEGNEENTSSQMPAGGQAKEVKSPRSNLVKSSIRSPAGQRRRSPNHGRRVRFDDSLFKDEDKRLMVESKDRTVDHYHEEVHSTFALLLFIYAIDAFVQQLIAHFQAWSLSVGGRLGAMLDEIFESREKMRVKQLQLIAKKVKILLDVHLTLLDYLNEIKTTYLIDKTLEVICARDSTRLVEVFKRPKIYNYVQRCMKLEEALLAGMLKQCLQIFFGLLVNEINFPPVELGAPSPRRSPDDANKSHENIINFVAGWLQVDDIIFGYARPKQTKDPLPRASVDRVANQIQRPNILNKASTLSLDGAYASSSRVLAQMDNLCEFLKSVATMTSDRLRHPQQTRFFFESLATGMSEFFEIVAGKLTHQLTSCTAKKAAPNAAKSAQVRPTRDSQKVDDKNKNDDDSDSNDDDIDLDLMAARIRCLKLIHIMTSAEKLIRAEAKRAQIDLNILDRLKTSMDTFARACLGASAMKESVKLLAKSTASPGKK